MRAVLGPEKWIVVMQAVAVTEVGGVTDADGLRQARTVLDTYTALPNYQRSWLRQGFDEADVVDGGSERLARTIFGIGNAATAAASTTHTSTSEPTMSSRSSATHRPRTLVRPWRPWPPHSDRCRSSLTAARSMEPTRRPASGSAILQRGGDDESVVRSPS
jgi:hypothetical protein